MPEELEPDEMKTPDTPEPDKKKEHPTFLVAGLYKADNHIDGALRSAGALYKNPPYIQIIDVDEAGEPYGMEVELDLYSAQDLKRQVDAVIQAYKGVDIREERRTFSKQWWKRTANETVGWVLHNKLLTALLVLVGLIMCSWALRLR